MTHYLGYEKGQAPKLGADQERENHRNGTSKKTLLSEDGKLEIEVPRSDQEGWPLAERARKAGSTFRAYLDTYAAAARRRF